MHNEIVEYLEAKGMGSWSVGIEATQILRRVQALRAQEPKAEKKMPEVPSVVAPLEHKMESDAAVLIIKGKLTI